MGRSSQRHNREIHGVDSAGQTPEDFGEKYNNLKPGGSNPSVPPGAEIRFVGTIPQLEGQDTVLFIDYDTTVHFEGTDVPITYSIATGPLPTGLNLTAGVITGTPTQTGTFPIVVRGIDNSTDFADSNSFDIVIAV